MAQIVSLTDIKTVLKKFKYNNYRIVLVGGCFDIIHPGHIAFLDAAKKQGDTLIVMLESDITVRRLKGENRPIHSQSERAQVLSHLDLVDIVVLLPELKSDQEYRKVIKTISPSVIAITQGDPIQDKKQAHADHIGAELKEVLSRQIKYASSKIAKQLKI